VTARTPHELETTSEPRQAPTQGSGQKTAAEQYHEEVARNPKWRDVTEPGRGLIIGGAHPMNLRAAKAEAELEALVTALVAGYPNLTREEARERLLTSGA
jgi:hypothetical protein